MRGGVGAYGGCGARWQERRTFDKKGNFEPKGVIVKDKIEGRRMQR